eukprot:TRINITY_DN1995_c0_g1_i3.p1 TRINITY_DN1995_c0_g1~~TRINITY_DN1995_c0_g1_i3.p1  ORF type:complete len:285 (-),score=55.72 TRINITY_DN1995_c0_g1_i3:703-1557(-)
MAQEYKLQSGPKDGISNIRFAPNSDMLLVSSWDTSVRLIDSQHDALRLTYNHSAPVLDCCFADDDSQAYSGGVDAQVKSCDIRTGAEFTIGSHSKGVRCLEYLKNHRLLVSGSWDATLKWWDVRTNGCVGTFVQHDKVFTVAQTDTRIVVGTAQRKIRVYDIRKPSEAEQDRDSVLLHQIRTIRCFPDGSGFAQSSIEGRVAMEYFDMNDEVQKRRYAFKCHRSSTAGVDTVYPVNAIAFHPTYGTFATGGCDGFVSVWDGENRKRLNQYHAYETRFVEISFSV